MHYIEVATLKAVSNSNTNFSSACIVLARMYYNIYAVINPIKEFKCYSYHTVLDC